MAGTAVTPRGGAALEHGVAPERGMPSARRMIPMWRAGTSRGTTPGRLRTMLALLILATLAWGALATFTVAQHASAAGDVVAANEPLTLDAQQIWSSLSDADDQAATAILAGGVEPATVRARYASDIKTAKIAIEDAAARGGPKDDLQTLSVGLSDYEADVATALADNRLGYPVGAAYLRAASGAMRAHLLPAANHLYVGETGRLTAASAQATGLPLVIVTVVAGLALGFGYYRASRWLLGRTHRVLNGGLLTAGAVGTVALLWLIGAFVAGRGDLLTAQSQGSTPVQALVDANIAVLQGHVDENLTLINNTGDDDSEADFTTRAAALGNGQGGLLAAAQRAAAGSPAAGQAQAAVTDVQAWLAKHRQVRRTDNSGDHLGAVDLVQSGASGAAFEKASLDLNNAIQADTLAFDANARSGQGAFTGLEAGMIIATLVMAGGIAWGLSRRLAEYR
jgi:hypothetical protein